VGVTFEMKPTKTLALQTKFHTWWLASARDGLYNAPGTLLVRDPTGRSGRHVGEEVDIQALWPAGKRIFVGAGVGHMFAGKFLREASPASGYTFSYGMITYTF
jgi:hypothetical protein